MNTKAKSPENRARNRAKRKAKKARERKALHDACLASREASNTHRLLSSIDTGKRVAGRKVYSLI